MLQDTSRVAVVTGASSGIGKAIAKALARDGWRVIGTGRDAARVKSAEAEIRAVSSSGSVDMVCADLSLLANAQRLAEEIGRLTPEVHLLVNNAGGMTDALSMTSEGLEKSFAGNHLGPFVLTQHLRPLLQAAAAASPKGTVRIINTASDASEMIPAINLDDMQNLAAFSPGLSYCTSKLANVLFAKALAGKWADDGITAHSAHPGSVDSNFFSYAPTDTQERARGMAKLSEDDGADTLIWLATSEEGAKTSGGYWYQRKPRLPNPLVNDPALVERFWQETEKLVARAKSIE